MTIGNHDGDSGEIDPSAPTGAFDSRGQPLPSQGSSEGDAAADGASGGAPSIPDVEIQRVLGRGGMGVVYLGLQPYIERRVAVKVLDREIGASDSGFVERFRREAKILAQLIHRNIVSCYQAGTTADGQCYLVMEFVDGPDLSGWVGQHGRLPTRHALELTLDLLHALEHAHGFGIIHRDVKPDNLLLAPKPEAPRDGSFRCLGKLADLGLAKPQEASPRDVQLTATGMVVGTPATMAPEQLNAPEMVDFRADLYGTGCVLYFALTGRHAFGGSDFTEIIVQKVTGDAPDPRHLLPTLDDEVAEYALKLLATASRDRPQSYREAIAGATALLERIATEGGAVSSAGGTVLERPDGRVNTDVEQQVRDERTIQLDGVPPESLAAMRESKRRRPGDEPGRGAIGEATVVADGGRGKRGGNGVLILCILGAVLLAAGTAAHYLGFLGGKDGDTRPEVATPGGESPDGPTTDQPTPGDGTEDDKTEGDPVRVPVEFGAGEALLATYDPLALELVGWDVEPEHSWADSADFEGAFRGNGRSVARRPLPDGPVRVEGLLHITLNDEFVFNEGGVAFELEDGTAYGLLLQSLGMNLTLAGIVEFSELPEDEVAGKRTEHVAGERHAGKRPARFALTYELGELRVELNGREIGAVPLPSPPASLALFAFGSEANLSQVSNLRLRVPAE